MVSLTTIPHLRINKNINIGTVIFVVEGEKDEFDLLEHIFTTIFDYVVAVPHERSPHFMMLASSKNPRHRIIIIRSDSSAINSIGRFEEYRDRLYGELFLKYNIDSTNSPVFYLWDRDNGSNAARMVRAVLSKMYSPYDNGYYENGLLLLSYPCLESYIVSCNEELDYFPLNQHPKKYIKRQNYKIDSINDSMLLVAATNMLARMRMLGANCFNPDNFIEANLTIFDAEETIASTDNRYAILSLISIALMYLDLIVIA